MANSLDLILQQAIQAFQRGNFASAEVALSRVLAVQPKNLSALHALGLIKASLSKHEEAAELLKKAIRLEPNESSLHYNLAKALQESGRDRESMPHHKKCINLAPNNPEAWLNYGKSLSRLGLNDEAFNAYQKSLEIKPNYVEALLNLGAALKELKQYEDAVIYANKAISFNPELSQAWSNKGVSLKELRRYDEALASYDQAISLKPDYHEAWSNKAVLLLHLKHYELGWDIYESRHNLIEFQFEALFKNLQLWDGSSSCKNLLVLPEQGIGDLVFYASMLERLENQVQSVTASIDARLISAFTRSFPGINFIDQKQSLNVDLYDAQIPFGSLSKILNMHPNMKGRHTPYLFDDPKFTAYIKKSLKPKGQLTCGIAWKSNNSKIGNEKSIALSELNKILEIKGFEFINLQYGNTEDEIRQLEQDFGSKITTIKGIDLFANIDGLLSIIQTCDVVVTTSNVTAHLSGALGKKTLLLAPYSAGRIWYWHDEYQSSWYPSISIYPQDMKFEWHKAIENIVINLNSQIRDLHNQQIKI